MKCKQYSFYHSFVDLTMISNSELGNPIMVYKNKNNTCSGIYSIELLVKMIDLAMSALFLMSNYFSVNVFVNYLFTLN